MRLDKYLKLTRIIKRRQVSKEIIENDRVEINGKQTKPATMVKVGDHIRLSFARTIVEVEVLEIDEKIIKKAPDGAYKIVTEEGNET